MTNTPTNMPTGDALGTPKNSVDVGGAFPSKLHFMLSEIEDEHSGIVSWAPHGRCFRVHQPEVFVEKLLTRWFNQSKYSSFQRQLNLYGFARITSGPDKNSYYHVRFLRGLPMLATSIQRIRLKGTGPRKPSTPENEPNFYVMKPLDESAFDDAREEAGNPFVAQTVNNALVSNMGTIFAPVALHAATASLNPFLPSVPMISGTTDLGVLLHLTNRAAAPRLGALPGMSNANVLGALALLQGQHVPQQAVIPSTPNIQGLQTRLWLAEREHRWNNANLQAQMLRQGAHHGAPVPLQPTLNVSEALQEIHIRNLLTNARSRGLM